MGRANPVSAGGDSPDGSYPGFRHFPIELFSTSKNYYAFDAANVLFLLLDEPSFAILSLLRERKMDVRGLIKALPRFGEAAIREAYVRIQELQDAGYLVPKRFQRDPRYDRAYIENTLTRRLAGLTLMITTNCNLACSYCIYGGRYGRYRRLSRHMMSWETARNALDFLIRHSPESREIRLDFFGGEPLLAFKLIKRCVDYLKTNLGPNGPKVWVTIASNGTILSEEILDFLVENKVYLQFSLDGRARLHNRRRKFRSNGRGSYRHVIKNIERIYARDREYFRERLKLKSVLTMESLSLSADRGKAHPLVFQIHKKQDFAAVIEERHYSIKKDAAYLREIHRLGRRLLMAKRKKTLSQLLKELSPRQKAFFRTTLGQFVDVQAINNVYFRKAVKVPFIKSCLPGYEEGIVHPDGRIAICHKAPVFTIGNVNSGGWNFDKIGELHGRLHENRAECRGCFIQRFCDLCFEKLPGGGRGWNKGLGDFCAFKREEYKLIFSYMLRILDNNPGLWTDLRKISAKQISEKLKKFAGLELEGAQDSSPQVFVERK